MENNTTVHAGAGFSSLLLIAFIVLKLIGIITWSWWWVLAPFWMPIAALVVGIGVVYVIAFIKDARKARNK